MFVPFVYSLDTDEKTENYYFYQHFFWYADACINNNWPMISHQRYFDRFLQIEDEYFGTPLKLIAEVYYLRKIPTYEDMLNLKAYPILQEKENTLIMKYTSQFECWIDILKNDNKEFEEIIEEQIVNIKTDYNENIEGILIYEYLPKALIKVANKYSIPILFQGGGVVRPPFTNDMNAFILINNNSSDYVRQKFDKFLFKNGINILSHKGLLRLFLSQKFMMDIHKIDDTPEYDAGVLHFNTKTALCHIGSKYITDQEMSDYTKKVFNKVLIRTRPGYQHTNDSFDNSPTCFHFCCKCKHIIGFATKGMFEGMLAGCITHEYGSSIFHSYCNDSIDDVSKDVAPVEFLNFVMFGLCIPFSWLTSVDYLKFIISEPSELDIYNRTYNYYTQGISYDNLKFYYMSSKREYRLGDMLYFNSGHYPHEYAAYYCTSKLYFSNNKYTWSNGAYTTFEFDLVENVSESLELFVLLYDVAVDKNHINSTQIVTCLVNNIDCGSITLTPGNNRMTFMIPISCISNNIQVKFLYSNLNIIKNAEIAIAFTQMSIYRSNQINNENTMLNDIAR